MNAPLSRQQRRAQNRQDRKRLGKLAPHQCGLGHVADAGLLTETLAFAKAMVDCYGHPPHELEVVAAHEAGHLIVTLAHGGDFKECYVQQQPDYPDTWVGYNDVFVPGVHAEQGAYFSPVLEPERAFKYAAQVIGGVAGEVAIKRFHGASSPEEVILSSAIGKVLGLSPQELVIAAACVIEDNRTAFDHARALLEAKHRITHDDIPGILALMSDNQTEAHRG